MTTTAQNITVLACGGRDYSDRLRVFMILDRVHMRFGIAQLIHGAARGADSLAADWADDRKIPARAFLADWDKHGNVAGPIRNKEMLTVGKPHLVVAFRGGAGTRHMVGIARVAGVSVLQVP